MTAAEMLRDFIGYGRNTPKFEWPNGARLALNLVVNYEEGAERNPLDGDPVQEAASEATYPMREGERELTRSRSRSTAAASASIAASICSTASRSIRRFSPARSRWNATPPLRLSSSSATTTSSATGLRWINHFGLTEPEEREQIRKARKSFARTINRPVVGWFNRMPQTIATRRILAEEGLLFNSAAVNDDIPYFQEVAGRPFLIVPYSVDVNDFRFWRGTMFTGRDFEIYCRDAFDTLYRESERTPRMLSVGLHSKIIGRPAQ